MKLIKMLLVAGFLTAGLAACADYYDDYGPNGYDYGPNGYDYDHGYDHHRPDMFWRGGHRYCQSYDDPESFYRCDPY